ncbi:pre-mRNA-splicing factor CWC22 homolog isoform X2 [Thrips palmi]|nr:pre-mRNA-splicing factor CWC22 homolog isoform X2 [Thrips palmi]XP_034237253.1 pre-mRNA-splicing factor CWC22 homolog isoform X2 [Thrips palmi]
MSSPDFEGRGKNASQSEESDNYDSNPSPPKKSKKKRNYDSEGPIPASKVRKVDASEEEEGEHKDDGSVHSGKDQVSKERLHDEKSKSSRRVKDKDQEEERGKERDKGRDRDRDYDRYKDRRRKNYEEYERDPPANFERYWGAGPKRSSYNDRDRRRRDDSDRDYDRYQDRRSGKDKGREVSGKVGPRYYGGKDDESKHVEENEDGKGPSSSSKDANKSEEVLSKPAEKKIVDMLTSRTGGAYIPPAKLRMMQAQITDKSSAAYQRIAWEALKKSIHGHINKVNTGNLATVIRELLQLNLVRGCGLLCRSIIQAQAASPTFTRVFAALISVINSRFPQIGELLVKRVVINFKRGFRRQDKASCISSAIFIAHLVNQCVAHELLALEILVLLVETPTSDSVEVAIAFLKEVVDKLLEVAKKGTMAIQDMLRNILHEGTLDKRVQYIIETMFQIIKVGGAKKLDDEQKQKEDEELLTLVEEEDQITHIINLDDAVDPQSILDVFKEDPQYEENEAAYAKLQKEILGSDSESGEEGSDEEEDSDEEDSDGEKKADKIIDNTETNLVALRRTIYLTIQSSLDFEECAHKLMRMQLKPGQEMEMCHMILDCCAEMRTYQKFFGLLAQRFCMINKLYISPFQQIFCDSFATVHRLEINKLRNVAKFFAHLLHTDAISWEVLSSCRLTEEDSTSSSRIFIKILFQELSEYLGLPKLNNRVKDATLQSAFEGLFPRDDPKNTRFAINFFTSIGLGGLTDELREHLKTQPRTQTVPLPIQNAVDETTSSSSSSDSSSSSSSSDSSDSSDSEDEKRKAKKKLKQKKGKADKSGKEGKKKGKKSETKSAEEMEESFEKRNKRDFDKGSKNQDDYARKNYSEKQHRMENEDWRQARKDVERGGRRDQHDRPDRRDQGDRPDRRNPNDRPDRRDTNERPDRRDQDGPERRDVDRGERGNFGRGEKKSFGREEKRNVERGEKGDRREMQREPRRNEEFESRRGSQKESHMNEFDKRQSDREHEKDHREREKEKSRHTDKEKYQQYEKNGDKDRHREREREKERHYR